MDDFTKAKIGAFVEGLGLVLITFDPFFHLMKLGVCVLLAGMIAGNYYFVQGKKGVKPTF